MVNIDDLKQFITAILCTLGVTTPAIATWIFTKGRKVLDYLNAIGDGVKITLRDRIHQSYKFHMKNGYCSIDDLTHVNDLFEQYTALGGNGSTEKLIKDIHNLPSLPPDKPVENKCDGCEKMKE